MTLTMKTEIDPKFLPSTRLEKAKWESPNEGVHERVNFDDTIWGFDLAGGIKYNTPLRITRVRDNSRAQKAGIKLGDKLVKINDILTETLSLQEAHDMIIESGIHIRLSVTAPEDKETTYHCWEDQPEPVFEKVVVEEPVKPRYFTCRVRQRTLKKDCAVGYEPEWTVAPYLTSPGSSTLSLQWPWISLPKTIYKESNCYLVPSKFESKFSHKLLPVVKQGPIILQPAAIAVQ